MAIEIFNRYENKYLLDKATYNSIQNRLLSHMELDRFNGQDGFYAICNLYLDTKDDYLIRNSICAPKYKEKLRIRSYGIPKEDEKVYFEIKKKFCGLVNKRRTILKLNEVYDFISTGIKPNPEKYMNRQVINEIAYMLKIYDLEPKLYITYNRTAFFSKESKSLRITFDTNIRTRRYDLKLESGDYGENLLENDRVLMEVKTENVIPLWLTKLLSEYKIYKTSFSKYGTEYEKMLINNYKMKGESKVCSKQFLMQPQLIPQYL